MRFPRLFVFLYLFVLAVVFCVPAQAADWTLVVNENGRPGNLYLTPTKFWAEGVEEEVIYFDVKKNRMYAINFAEETYIEITQEDLARLNEEIEKQMEGLGDMSEMAGQMAGAMAQMEKALEGMDEAEQKMIREQLAKSMPQAEAPGMPSAEPAKKRFEPMDKNVKLHGVSCEGFKIMVGDRQSGEVYTAQPGDLGMATKDFAAMVAMGEFVKDGMAGMDMGDDSFVEGYFFNPDHESFIGLPIKQVTWGFSTETKHVTEIVSWKKGKIDPEKTTIPSHFTKTSIMDAFSPPQGK